ncbi:MAG TPA: 6,7-dimethyl-8-ribityllumazine synthase [Bacteroidia bacterium]|nr:6,7-dimethyl-8-ribityllumazine synthase [Bacteroidia bacterium]
MSTLNKNLSEFEAASTPSASGMRIAVVVSEWNTEITEALFTGVRDCLLELGCSPADILRKSVPGSFELPLGAQWMAEKESPDAVICLGCVIQGETRHFDFICSAVADGLMNLGVKFSLPFIFGVLTPDTMQQALDRAGGKYGNKGIEAAVTAVKMIALRRELKQS